MKCLDCNAPAQPQDLLCARHRTDENLRKAGAGKATFPVEPSRVRAFCPGEVAPVPAWARFVATDRDGAVWAYAERPQVEVACWTPPSLAVRIELLGFVPPHALWRDTLVEAAIAREVQSVAEAQGTRGLIAVAWAGVIAYAVLEGGRAAGWWSW